MLLEISSEMVMANLFSSGMTFVTERDLNEVRRKIESVRGWVYVDVCAKSVQWTIEQNPRLFKEFTIGEGITYIIPINSKIFTEDYCNERYNWIIGETERELLIPILRGKFDQI